MINKKNKQTDNKIYSGARYKFDSTRTSKTWRLAIQGRGTGINNTAELSTYS
jgi:hypothetical protein